MLIVFDGADGAVSLMCQTYASYTVFAVRPVTCSVTIPAASVVWSTNAPVPARIQTSVGLSGSPVVQPGSKRVSPAGRAGNVARRLVGGPSGKSRAAVAETTVVKADTPLTFLWRIL